MLILGIDTSTKIGDFCIYDDEKGVIAKVKINVELNHSNIIMKAITELFELSKVSKEAIRMVAVGIGPGSFTGVRVGLGVAKGIAYSMNIPLRAVNTLDAIAQNVLSFDGIILSTIDARNTRVFYSFYKQKNYKILERISEYEDGEILYLLEKIKEEKVIIVGDGVEKNRLFFEKHIKNKNNIILGNFYQNTISSENICYLAINQVENNNIFSLEPFYLVKSQAERNK